MRILIVSSDFGVPVYGHKGASIHLRAMARAFTDLGHEPIIFSPALAREAHFDFEIPTQDPVSLESHHPSLATLRHLDRRLGKQANGHVSRVQQEVRNLLYNEGLAGALEAARARAPQVVYERYALFGFGGIELARALDIPHVLEVNAPLCLEQERVRGLHLAQLAQALERRIWSSTDAVLAVSDEMAAMARSAGAAADRVHVLPNGVDAERFAAPAGARERVRAALGLGGGPVVGFVGSLKPWHGTQVLLPAFATVYSRRPDARLLLVGDGPMAEELRAEARRLGIEAAVRLTGAVEHGQVPEMLAAMDIAVAPYLPSDDFYFSPIKVFEYLAAGLPVVASRLGQIVPLVEVGHVWPARPGDAADLASALETVLASPADAMRRAADGRRWVLVERTWMANARRALDIAATRSTVGARIEKEIP